MSIIPREHTFIDGIECALCSKCARFLPLKSYYKKSSTVDKLTSQCKVCIKEYEQNNKEQIKQYQSNYRGLNQEKLKNYNKEWVKKQGEGYRSEYFAKYREDHKESYSTWYKEHFKKPEAKEKYRKNCIARRARKKENGGTLTEHNWVECLSFFDFKDAYTGLELEVASMDHIIPLINGGRHSRNNIVPCENSINKSKNNTILEKWYRKQEFFSEERLNKIYEWMERTN